VVVGSGPMASLVYDYVHYLCCCLGALFVLCALPYLHYMFIYFYLCLGLFELQVYLFIVSG
jgi:hypothetical protein